ncbi:MAG TPA: hypothetical protein VI756_08035 [Blastocatellia bacterium]
MSADEFESIKIVACDETKVKKQAGNKTQYTIPFSLSSKPPRGWPDFFDKSWRSLRKASGTSKADAYLRKSELVVETPLAEINIVFPVLKSAVADTNAKYQEHAKARADKDGKKKQKRKDEREAELVSIREALSGLDFS